MYWLTRYASKQLYSQRYSVSPFMYLCRFVGTADFRRGKARAKRLTPGVAYRKISRDQTAGETYE